MNLVTSNIKKKKKKEITHYFTLHQFFALTPF